MFSKTLRLHKTLRTFQSTILKARRGFTSSKNPRILEMLEKIGQNPKSYQEKSNFQDLILLDKLNETRFSTTFRAFNRQTESFVAHQTILLENPLSFAQMELILDQYNKSPQRSHFSDVLSIQYDKKRKEAQILTELDKATLQDIASYIAMNPNQLTDNMLTEYAWQLLDLIVHPRSADSLQLQNLFVDFKGNSLKVHDFLDFAISRAYPLSPGNSKKDSMATISSVIKKIANTTDEEVLQRRFPKTAKSLQEMKEIAQDMDKEYLEKAMMGLRMKLKSRESMNSMVSDHYNSFITEKLLNILKEKSLSKFVENAELLKKVLNKSNQQIYFDHLQNLTKTEEAQLSQAKYYKTLDQFELSSKFYSQAFKTRREIEQTERLLKKSEHLSHHQIEPVYKSPIVEYLDSLPKFVTQVVLPMFILCLMFLITAASLERNQAAWEPQKPSSPSQEEIAAKKLEEVKEKEKRQQRIQLFKFGVSALTITGLSFL